MLDRVKKVLSRNPAPAASAPTPAPQPSAAPAARATTARTALDDNPFGEASQGRWFATRRATNALAKARSQIQALLSGSGDRKSSDAVIARALQTEGPRLDALIGRTAYALQWLAETPGADPVRVAEIVPKLIKPVLDWLRPHSPVPDSKARGTDPGPAEPLTLALEDPARPKYIRLLTTLARLPNCPERAIAQCLQPLPRDVQMRVLLELRPERATKLLEASLAIATAESAPQTATMPALNDPAVREAWHRIDALKAAILEALPAWGTRPAQQALWTRLAATCLATPDKTVGKAARIKLFKAASTEFQDPSINEAALRGILLPLFAKARAQGVLTPTLQQILRELHTGHGKAAEEGWACHEPFLIDTVNLAAAAGAPEAPTPQAPPVPNPTEFATPPARTHSTHRASREARTSAPAASNRPANRPVLAALRAKEDVVEEPPAPGHDSLVPLPKGRPLVPHFVIQWEEPQPVDAVEEAHDPQHPFAAPDTPPYPSPGPEESDDFDDRPDAPSAPTWAAPQPPSQAARAVNPRGQPEHLTD